MSNELFKHFDLRAAIIFIAAHFVSVGIYDLLVVGDNFAIPKGGFILYMLQAALFLSLPLLKIKFELSIIAVITSIFYCLMAINFFCLARWDETGIQNYFYSVFPSIIMTINLIVICLLGKDIFNKFFMRRSFLSKIQLFLRSVSNNSVCNINAPISVKNFKSEKGSK